MASLLPPTKLLHTAHHIIENSYRK